MAIAYVNSTSGADFGGGGFTNLTTAAFSVSAGNLIVAGMRVYRSTDPGSGAVSSVTVTDGNTYVRAVRTYFPASDGSDVEIWYAENIGGHATNVVSFNMNNSNYQYWSVVAAQYSGLATSSALDTTATGSQASGTSVTSGAFTTTQADEVLISIQTYDAATGQVWTQGSGYTDRINDTAEVLMLQDKIVSAIQTTVTASASIPVSRNLTQAVATFKAPGGGGGGGRIFKLAGFGGGLVGPARGLVG